MVLPLFLLLPLTLDAPDLNAFDVFALTFSVPRSCVLMLLLLLLVLLILIPNAPTPNVPHSHS
jgi:hypothetical protein